MDSNLIFTSPSASMDLYVLSKWLNLKIYQVLDDLVSFSSLSAVSHMTQYYGVNFEIIFECRLIGKRKRSLTVGFPIYHNLLI